MSHRWFLIWALTPLVGLPASAQSVISAHSGLIHFSDGSVFLDDQPIQQKTGRFEQMNNGSELRTQDGRVEVLLTPGTFLRLGSNSAIRMISNDLDNTRVELLSGSAVLDQGSDTLANSSVTVIYNLDEVHINKPGRYRFDSEPPQLKVETGDAEVKGEGKTVEASAGNVVALDGKLTTRQLLNKPDANAGDALDQWAEARNNSVAQDNQDAAATSDLSKTIDGWQNNPDEVLQSLGIPPYIPGMSSMVPPLGYGSGLNDPNLYGSGLYSSSLYGSPLYGYGTGLYGAGVGVGLAPYTFYGFDPIMPLFLYGMPLYRGAYASPYIYRGLTTIPGRTGYTYGPIGTRYGYGTTRPGLGIGAARPAFGGMRIGGIHAVGGRR